MSQQFQDTVNGKKPIYTKEKYGNQGDYFKTLRQQWFFQEQIQELTPLVDEK